MLVSPDVRLPSRTIPFHDTLEEEEVITIAVSHVCQSEEHISTVKSIGGGRNMKVEMHENND